jgi:hypothetical protein
MKPQWQFTDQDRWLLRTALIRIYVSEEKDGWQYRVCCDYALRWSQKPIATEQEAKAASITAAQKLLRAEIDTLISLAEVPTERTTHETN